jgi:carboxypeptidase Q
VFASRARVCLTALTVLAGIHWTPLDLGAVEPRGDSTPGADSSQSGPDMVPGWLEPYRATAARLSGEAQADATAWRRLSALTDAIGPRFSGTPQLDRAIEWAVAEMGRDGLENVHTEPVMVPTWVRGQEAAEVLGPAPRSLVMLGLGGSVGTSPEGIQAPLLVVHSFQELESRASDVRGRVVLFNAPFTNYFETVRFRLDGPSRAARFGAVAALVRSVGPPGLRLAHTGALQYEPDVPQIPAAALATEDADRLERIGDRGGPVVVRLRMEAHFEPDAPSANVIAEIRGREQPDDIVLVSGHLDSWDVGDGASDDGGGCVVAWEALRLMKRLRLRPRRTVRLVLWTNEENGGRGGLAYRDRHRAELGKHVLMLESDSGVSRPVGFGFTGSDRARHTVTAVASLLREMGADRIGTAGSGADIAPSVQEGKIASMALDVDGSKYFAVHHTMADTVDKIDPVEMARCAAAIAVMAYVVAELPERLGH